MALNYVCLCVSVCICDTIFLLKEDHILNIIQILNKNKCNENLTTDEKHCPINLYNIVYYKFMQEKECTCSLLCIHAEQISIDVFVYP